MLVRNPRLFPTLASHFLPCSFELGLICRNTVGSDLLEPELLLSLAGDPNWLSMVSHRRGTTWRSGLQETEKDHRSAARCMGEGEILAGFFVTFELALLHEEGMRAIPTGCFDRVGIDSGTLGSQRRWNPYRGELQLPCHRCLARRVENKPLSGQRTL